VEILDETKKPLGKFKFKTNFFRDYWTDEILCLKDCFIFYEQGTLFYKRFYDGADFVGIREGKFCEVVDFVAKDLLNQSKKKGSLLCPIQFSLLELVKREICYENKYPLESSHF
jgi:hypothetical protein